MARFRLKMLPLNLVALIGAMAWAASAASPSPSPSASAELICHTDNPAECYPKVFQATDEFQVVHDDQDLPIGLHVRLDVSTGKKEAKINVPDEDHPALAGLPVDTSVVLVERDNESDEQARISPDAPAYDPVGKIKAPQPPTSDEGSAFFQSLAMLQKGLDGDAALETLEEISHDIYYGLKIAEDYNTIHALLCLTATPSPPSPNRARLAALTLASTLQNNPSALASITAHWPRLSASTCPSSANPQPPLGTATFNLNLHLPATTTTTDTPLLTKARLATLTNLLRSPTIRADFLASRGPSQLLHLLTSPTFQTPDWEPAQRRAALLLLDNFLDRDMGAALGEWPVQGQASDAACEAAAGGSGDGEECWDWRVGRVARAHRGDEGHWSHELGRRVVEQRRVNRKAGKGKGREEL
ncbi:hypothetical protein BT67DRAFT_135936 [Trichocladium antarcticum]|uniref:Nucleotide exchange factor SIL1 n=1 Tax=Trichocladium antarcticum TaxID=1450529 RepID=A0AAN6UHN2_9PEZI|nr:hypothetical protein BT67DRAFT_135936 [Trichocladium antarcticum]